MSRKCKESFNFPNISKNQLENIIKNEDGGEVLVKCAEDIGKSLACPAKGKELTTSQVRAIFGEVRRIEGEWKNTEKAGHASRQLILLKPKMAYRAKKEPGQGIEELVSVLDPAIDLVAGSQENFTRFVDFFEAILAYHKAYGGS